MHVISKKSLEAFWLKHPAANAPLEAWYRLAKTSSFDNFVEVKRAFDSADYVPPYIVFNVAGNNFRIISVVHFNRQKLYVREVFTHSEYDRWSKLNRSKKS
jgi:mRNA interferase HigB